MDIAIYVVNTFLPLGGMENVSALYISYATPWLDFLVGILPSFPRIFTFKASLLVGV